MYWESLPKISMDPIVANGQRFREDKDPRKVSLVVGVYRTDEGKPYLFSVVRRAEEILAKEALDKARMM